MNTTHTPGPWTVEGEAVYANRDARSRHRNGRACVANVCTGDYDQLDAEGKANAALIAAAPDLLAVLQEIDEHGTDDWQARLKTIRAAIAKATGAKVESSPAQKELYRVMLVAQVKHVQMREGDADAPCTDEERAAKGMAPMTIEEAELTLQAF